MPDHGTFMDGGLSSNNPTPLALQEAHRLAPARRPALFVSIGTGFSPGVEGPKVEVGASFRLANVPLYQTALHYWKENFNGNNLDSFSAHIRCWTHRRPVALMITTAGSIDTTCPSRDISQTWRTQMRSMVWPNWPGLISINIRQCKNSRFRPSLRCSIFSYAVCRSTSKDDTRATVAYSADFQSYILRLAS
jgi:hypothetical protein